MPPPATPTPHRFLVPRRSQQVKNDETPKAFQFQTSSGLQQSQFQATPRFSLHSTPRAPGSGVSSSTPAPSATVSRQRNADPINDIDSSPPPLARVSARSETQYQRQQQPQRRSYESFEIDDLDVVLESSPIRPTGSQNASDDGLETRLPKRRRLSLSSFGPGTEDDEDMPDGDAIEIESSLPDASPDPDEVYAATTSSTADDIEDAHAQPVFPSVEEIASAQQPTFLRAPRFVTAADAPQAGPSLSAHGSEPRPDVFSPHNRKGHRYVPGGLAASLRDWLVDAGSGSARDAEEWIARIRVDEVRSGVGDGMTLVAGRQVVGGGQPDASAASFRVLLAGPGRLTGLARRHEVRPGEVVGVARPTWDVVLRDMGRWAVAYDWAVI
ncbi:hypothetical protein F4810DRAFT_650628, partial [Camillea tinctor]